MMTGKEQEDDARKACEDISHEICARHQTFGSPGEQERTKVQIAEFCRLYMVPYRIYRYVQEQAGKQLYTLEQYENINEDRALGATAT